MTLPPFHLAFPVHDLARARAFYVDLLGCRLGRVSERWIDLDLHGHQLSAHLVDDLAPPPPVSLVDGDRVPIPHFGLVLAWNDWHALAERLKAAEASFGGFVIAPRVRFQGQPGEQATMFLSDPSGNHLEFKSFQDPRQLFAV